MFNENEIERQREEYTRRVHAIAPYTKELPKFSLQTKVLWRYSEKNNQDKPNN